MTIQHTQNQRTNVLDRDEACNLIASDKVESTTVYDRQGEKLGTTRKVMIDKESGQVRHVVMGFGGLFGMGEDNYPVPWDALDYDTKLDGYKMKSLSKGDLNKDKAPSYKADQEPAWDRDYDRTVRSYYIIA